MISPKPLPATRIRAPILDQRLPVPGAVKTHGRQLLLKCLYYDGEKSVLRMYGLYYLYYAYMMVRKGVSNA